MVWTTAGAAAWIGGQTALYYVLPELLGEAAVYGTAVIGTVVYGGLGASEAVEVWSGENWVLETCFGGDYANYQTAKDIALLADMGIILTGQYAKQLGYEPKKKGREISGGNESINKQDSDSIVDGQEKDAFDGTADGEIADIGNPVDVVGRGSTGRTEANSLEEQIAIQEVKSNPLENATKVPIPMTDPRWEASEGWVKLQRVIQYMGNDGKTKNITIHFLYNELTGEFNDFKFK